MKWPWQPRPGMVRVSRRQLIELQRAALRAGQLEEENRERQAENRRLDATERAAQLLALLSSPGEPDSAVCAWVLADLPLTAEGGLHEGALLALHRQEVELATLIGE